MSLHWAIHHNHLVVSGDSQIVSPSAEEVYAALTGSPERCSDCVRQAGVLQVVFPELKIATLPSPIKCRVYIDGQGVITLQPYCVKKGKEINIDLINGRIIDHYLVDNQVVFVDGPISDLEELFKTANILSDGALSMRQYLKIVEIEAFAGSKLVENLVDLGIIKEQKENGPNVPSTLNATLFPYQETGFRWIHYMLNDSGGCILGDEMGLGKTMQVIATMLDYKNQDAVPMLVIAPVSLLANWKRECEKFAPSLNVHIHHGINRISNYRDFLKYDVIVTAYSTVVSDIYMMNMVSWKLVALDEAQNIKNPYSARTKACKSLNRATSVAVTGTPFENHMTDIWSLLDFVQPGLLGSLQTYKANVTDDVFGGETMEPILSPLMVRRLVKDVAQDLPERIDIPQPIQMSDEEAEQYKSYLEEIKEAFDSEAINIGMLQKLRMFCTHPFICSDKPIRVNPCEDSVKYQRLCEILDEVIARNEKVLIFTSYKKMFEVFNIDLEHRYGIPVYNINGETPVDERQSIVDEFNEQVGSAALVLNPRAAGTGLNITGANHVIHYNLEWNPALEDQASARAYRRGQEKTVFVYRLYYKDTVEQVVNERIERKRDTAEAAVVGTDGISIDRQDIIRALELIPSIRTK